MSPNPPHFRLDRAIRPNILTLEPYRCARDDYDEGILLDANENAMGHSLSTSEGDESKQSTHSSNPSPQSYYGPGQYPSHPRYQLPRALDSAPLRARRLEVVSQAKR